MNCNAADTVLWQVVPARACAPSTALHTWLNPCSSQHANSTLTTPLCSTLSLSLFSLHSCRTCSSASRQRPPPQQQPAAPPSSCSSTTQHCTTDCSSMASASSRCSRRWLLCRRVLLMWRPALTGCVLVCRSSSCRAGSGAAADWVRAVMASRCVGVKGFTVSVWGVSRISNALQHHGVRRLSWEQRVGCGACTLVWQQLRLDEHLQCCVQRCCVQRC